MNIWPIAALGLLFVLILVAYCCSKRLSRLARSHSALLNLLSTFAALSVFVQLYYTVYQFNEVQLTEQEQRAADRQREETERRLHFVARMKALDAEVKWNFLVCAVLRTRMDDALGGLVALHSRFHYVVLEQVLASGEITHEDFRFQLWSGYHRMILANDSIEHSVDLVNLRSLGKSDAAPIDMRNDRLKESAALILKSVEIIEKSLGRCQEYLPKYIDGTLE